ncbi:MAG: hypothetical protein ACRDNI_06810 [Gaiellaceae bacterium]
MVNFADASYPWPRKGDDPFALDADWSSNACLNFMNDEPWFGYVRGYKLAGDLAVDHVERKRYDSDTLVYPILFNYRQYLELVLKSLIRDARLLLDERGGAPDGHNLMHLWNTAQPLLLRIEPKSRNDLDNVGSCLAHFARLDPNSEAFRYPVDLDGNPSLPEDLFHINLSKVRNVIANLDGFFYAADTHISALLEFKAEAEAEGRAAEAEMEREMLRAFGDSSF